MKGLEPLQRPPLVSQSVQMAIREYIVSNDLQSDAPLPPETQLAEQLGVSRNSVREAVKALESLGIVETRRGSGIFVKAFSLEPLLGNLQYDLLFNMRDLRELLQVRRVLETGMIGDAMGVMSPERLDRLREIVERMRVRAEKGEAFPEEDREFHQCLFEDLGNETLLELLDIFWLTFQKASEHTDIADYEPEYTYQLHLPIIEALSTGDLQKAADALKQHYSGLEGRLERVRRE